MPTQWLRPWRLVRALAENGVLGINARNADLILRQNPRSAYPQVDDKAATKALCHRHGVPMPRTYAIVGRNGDLGDLLEQLRSCDSFVVKPARGAGGRGVVVVTGRRQDRFVTAARDELSPDALRCHLQEVLSGLFSLGSRCDRVIVEERVICHPELQAIAVNGTPDMRIVIHAGRPVMAMVRLPTRCSRGRANLHLGAAAAGICLATGETIGGVWGSRCTDRHPDTGNPIAGHRIPDWPRALEVARQLAAVLGLRYVGIDIVIDARHGPLVLEANARPGLAVQIANRRGLRHALAALPPEMPETPPPPPRQHPVAGHRPEPAEPSLRRPSRTPHEAPA